MMRALQDLAFSEYLFYMYHGSAFGGYLRGDRIILELFHRFYWTGIPNDVQQWLSECMICMKRKLPSS